MEPIGALINKEVIGSFNLLSPWLDLGQEPTLY